MPMYVIKTEVLCKENILLKYHYKQVLTARIPHSGHPP